VKLAAAASAAAALLCAGCGGSDRAQQPPTPKLPRALAQAWSRDARAIAAALAAGDACGARAQASRLQTAVIAAVNARRVPPDFLEPLTSAVNSLPERIVCTPPAPTQPAATPGPPGKPKHGKPEQHPHGHGKGRKKGHDG
jgi:hypothetical protein